MRAAPDAAASMGGVAREARAARDDLDRAIADLEACDAAIADYEDLDTVLIVFEGDIGAGKSTLLKEFAARIRAKGATVVEVAEPVDTWVQLGALQQFYADPAFAYQFQTLVYSTRILAFTRALAEARGRGEKPDIVLAERSPATDALFAAVANFTPMERAMYRTWCDAFNEVGVIKEMLSEAYAVYLRPSIAACEARCAARGRDGEALDPAYRRRLRAAHDLFLLGEAEVPADAVGLEVPRAPYERVLLIEGEESVASIVDNILEQFA